MSYDFQEELHWNVTPITPIENDQLYFFFGKPGKEIVGAIVSGNYEHFQKSLLAFFQKEGQKTFKTEEINTMLSKLLEILNPTSEGKIKRFVQELLAQNGRYKNRKMARDAIVSVASYMQRTEESEYTGSMLYEYLQEWFEVWYS